MPDPDRSTCSRVRDVLLDQAMALEERPPDAHVVRHLAACADCRAFAGHLATTRGAFRRTTVVGPELRRQTVVAVARHAARRRPPHWWLLPPAVVLGVVLSFALPLWMTEQLLRPLLGASPLTIALGLVAVASQAVLASAALYLSVSLTRRPAAHMARPVLEV